MAREEKSLSCKDGAANRRRDQMTPQEYSRATITMSCLALTLEAASARGMPQEQLLQDVELPDHWMQRPDARIPLASYGRIIERTLRLGADSGIGLDIGLRCILTQHGFLGLGVMSQRNLREAADFVQRYFFKLCFPLCNGALQLQDRLAIVNLHCDLPSAPLQRYAVEAAMGGLVKVLQHFIALEEIECWFEFPEPAWFAGYRERMPATRFSMGANRLQFPAPCLDRPSATACAMTARLVTTQCERELQMLHVNDRLLDRCRALLARCDGQYPALEVLARELCMSPRTLKRRLQEHGQSFTALLDEARYGESVRLLRATRLSLEQIADRLGYSSASNFSRAFRGWSGLPPGTFREGRDTADNASRRVAPARAALPPPGWPEPIQAGPLAR